MAASGPDRSHPGRDCICSAFISNGGCCSRSIRAFWQPAVDSRHVLRDRCRRNCNHRAERNQAGAHNCSRRCMLWTIFAALAITTAWTQSEMIWLFILSGSVAMFIKAPPSASQGRSIMLFAGTNPLLSGIHGVAGAATVGGLFLFFLKAGAFVFGSGLAIVPFLYGGVVVKFHWLTEHQFVDAVAVAMITPGPVVITAAFIGYLVAGVVGAVLAAFAVFAPPYLIILFGAPYYRRFAQNRQVKAFVQGVTAAAVGAIAGAAYILARRSLF